MKTVLLSGLTACFLSIVGGLVFIPALKKLKAGQPILKYVEEHKDKGGTPTMGGLFFITSAVVSYFIFDGSYGRTSLVAVSIGLAFMSVGFLDDFIKIKFKKNEGLKAYQKILFQTAIAVIAGFFAYKSGHTDFYIPFTSATVNFGVFTVPFTALIFIAITNSVNLTDGLDGLAGSVSATYLVAIAAVTVQQLTYFGQPAVQQGEAEGLIILCACLVGAILGFLIFNVNKASAFMGDTGSLSLGGFLGAISIFTSNSFYIPVIGVMFVLSSVSVIIQVLHFKRTGKRVFLMAPFHHHLQKKGLSEGKISFIYSLITGIIGLVCLISYF